MPKQIPTNKNDSIFVAVSLTRLTKATQALVEVKYRRLQNDNYEQILNKKDSVIYKLIQANKLSHELNNEYETKIGALVIKGNEYDALYKDYKFELKQSKRKELITKISYSVGLPVVFVVGGIAGFYLYKFIK